MLVELFFRHAVRATKIAPVHHRNAQVVQRAAQPIERVVRAANVVDNAVHERRITNGTRWQRSLWHRCWVRAAVPQNRPCPRGSKNRLNRSAAAEWPTGGPSHHAQSSPARSTRASA